MSRRDAQNSGVVDHYGPARRVTQRWRTGTRLTGEPVVANGLVVVGVNSNRRTLIALDAATGTFVWDARLPGTALSTTPAAADELVLALTGEFLCGVELGSGELRWKRRIETNWSSDIAVVDETAFVSTDRQVVAVSISDGELRWRAEVDYAEGGPAVADGRVYAATRLRDGGRLYVLDADTGTREWTLSTESRLLAPPVVVDGTVFLCDEPGVTAVSTADDGRVRWQFRPDINWDANGEYVLGARAPPAATTDRLYVPVPDGHLYALDTATGGRVWETQFWGQPKGPLVAAETVFTASRDSYLYAVDPSTGRRRWERGFPKSVAAPVLVDELLFVTAGDGSLSALEEA